MTNGKATWRRLIPVLAAGGGALAFRRLAQRNQAAGRIVLPRGRAVITGASAGIGEAFARRLAAAGFDLTLVARREERLAALAAELNTVYDVDVRAWPADLTREGDVAALGDYLSAAGDLVLLVNNAGFGTRGELVEVPLERTLDMIRLHVVATVVLSRAALAGMLARGRGAIINVSSIAAFFPSGGGANYGATKAYLNAFSEALAAEVRDRGISVQALCPGFTATEFHEVGDYQAFDRRQIPNALWMPADEVVAESLAALGNGRVIVVPGARYRAMVATTRGPFGGPIRRLGQRIRRRWRKREGEQKDALTDPPSNALPMDTDRSA